MPAVSPEDDTRTIFDKVFQSGIKTLRDTLSMMDHQTVETAVKMLHEASRVEFYGVGTSATIATDAYFRLMRIGYPAGSATDSQIMRISAASLVPGQVAVGISHSGRAAETIDAMRLAKAQGAGTIVITSHRDSQICKYADLVLCVYSDESRYPVEAVSARLAHIAVLDAICVALAILNNERTTRHIHKMNELFGEIRK
jgi:DNA-binding MurR/RpiR family transcriptional regulator